MKKDKRHDGGLNFGFKKGKIIIYEKSNSSRTLDSSSRTLKATDSDIRLSSRVKIDSSERKGGRRKIGKNYTTSQQSPLMEHLWSSHSDLPLMYEEPPRSRGCWAALMTDLVDPEEQASRGSLAAMTGWKDPEELPRNKLDKTVESASSRGLQLRRTNSKSRSLNDAQSNIHPVGVSVKKVGLERFTSGFSNSNNVGFPTNDSLDVPRRVGRDDKARRQVQQSKGDVSQKVPAAIEVSNRSCASSRFWRSNDWRDVYSQVEGGDKSRQAPEMPSVIEVSDCSSTGTPRSGFWSFIDSLDLHSEVRCDDKARRQARQNKEALAWPQVPTAGKASNHSSAPSRFWSSNDSLNFSNQVECDDKARQRRREQTPSWQESNSQ